MRCSRSRHGRFAVTNVSFASPSVESRGQMHFSVRGVALALPIVQQLHLMASRRHAADAKAGPRDLPEPHLADTQLTARPPYVVPHVGGTPGQRYHACDGLTYGLTVAAMTWSEVAPRILAPQGSL